MVDLMFQIISFFPRDLATASASIVLPVPGSPLIRRGFFSAMATFTALKSSSLATYSPVPAKPFSLILEVSLRF